MSTFFKCIVSLRGLQVQYPNTDSKNKSPWLQILRARKVVNRLIDFIYLFLSQGSYKNIYNISGFFPIMVSTQDQGLSDQLSNISTI